MSRKLHRYREFRPCPLLILLSAVGQLLAAVDPAEALSLLMPLSAVGQLLAAVDPAEALSLLMPLSAVAQLLAAVDPAEALSLCARLDALEARSAVLSGVCRTQGRRMPAGLYCRLYRRAAGLRLLLTLGEAWPYYRHLADRPELIAVQLIVNQHYQVMPGGSK